MVEDSLEVFYDTGEGGEHAVMHPKAYNVIALLVAEGCTDLGPIYTSLAEAQAAVAAASPPTPAAAGPRLAPFNPDRPE